jgi:hypothetical protein
VTNFECILKVKSHGSSVATKRLYRQSFELSDHLKTFSSPLKKEKKKERKKERREEKEKRKERKEMETTPDVCGHEDSAAPSLSALLADESYCRIGLPIPIEYRQLWYEKAKANKNVSGRADLGDLDASAK